MSLRVLGPRLSGIQRRYYCGPDHPMKLRLWSWLRRVTGHPRLTIPYGDGVWITVDERDWLERQLLLTGAYEAEVWSALASLARAGDILWDVGAHVGVVSLRAAVDRRFVEIHAFEPDPLTRAILVRHADLNRVAVRVHPWALSDRRERRPLFRGPSINAGMSSLVFRGDRARFEVECATADELVREGRVPAPTLLKIDVEGWEGQVLAGADRLLTECPPRAIVLEAGCGGAGTMADPELEARLQRLRYRVRRLVRPDGQIMERENFLAIHDASSPRWHPGRVGRGESSMVGSPAPPATTGSGS